MEKKPNILLVTGHPYEDISVANMLIVEELKRPLPGLLPSSQSLILRLWQP